MLHRGVRPQARAIPDYLSPLGSTFGWPANGAMSNLAITPHAVATLRKELGAYAPDVIHLHEPPAPALSWDTLTSASAPIVGTFHCHSERRLPHTVAALFGARRKLNRLTRRIAVSEAAAWTGRRFYGGDYAIIPNGVDLPAAGVPAARTRAAGDPLRIVFVGQSVERKGLPVLLRAFEALHAEVPATLTIVGATPDEIAPLLVDPTDVTALGRISDVHKHEALAAADVLCAPSLGGESFGMVLTEAFAAGTPVVASDIAGYRDVVSHGVNGLLVPRGDATALAETLLELALDPAQATRMSEAAGASAQRYAWAHVAEEIASVYEEAVAAPRPQTRLARVKERYGIVPAGQAARVPAQRLPSLEAPVHARRRRGAATRRAAFVLATLVAVAGATLAVQRIGLDAIGSALLSSSPSWVILAVALMCFSMVLRAVCWRAILKAAMPDARPRFADAMQGTAIGVLMSATLPARLGEPSRALIVARRLGDPRTRLPVVLGTIVSQALLNVLALLILGAVMFSTVGLFAGRQTALVFYAIAPLVVLSIVLLAPALLRSGLPSRSVRLHRALSQARGAATRLRAGLLVFRRPKLGAVAVLFQLAAWGVQWASCFVSAGRAGPRRARRRRRRRRGSVRGQHHRRAAGHTVEPRRLPGRLRRRADRRVRRLRRRRARLRDHPAVGRDRDRRDHGRPRPGQGGRVVARGAPARAAPLARVAVAAWARGGGHGVGAPPPASG